MARTFIDDLPASELVSRLRADGRITASSTSVGIAFGHGEEALSRIVGVAHVRFRRNGGDWAFYKCPACHGLACRLRLHDGGPKCRRCLLKAGVPYRITNSAGLERAAARRARIERLEDRLAGERHELLKPRRAGTVERRARLEASLRRARIVERRQGLRAAHVL